MKQIKAYTSMHVVITLVFLVFAFVILLYIFNNFIKQEKGEIEDSLGGSRDYDNDGIVDYFDKCPCDGGAEEDDGCDDAHIGGYDETAKTACDALRKGT